MSAEQFSRQEVIYLSFTPCGCVSGQRKPPLHRFKEVFVDNGWNGVFLLYVFVDVCSDISHILKYGFKTASVKLSNIGLGLTGEAGEVADILKKYLHHGHDLDVNELILELGDVLYYICWLCLKIGVDFSELCFENMEKLNARYPDGFDSEKSIHRKEYENA